MDPINNSNNLYFNPDTTKRTRDDDTIGISKFRKISDETNTPSKLEELVLAVNSAADFSEIVLEPEINPQQIDVSSNEFANDINGLGNDLAVDSQDPDNLEAEFLKVIKDYDNAYSQIISDVENSALLVKEVTVSKQRVADPITDEEFAVVKEWTKTLVIKNNTISMKQWKEITRTLNDNRHIREHQKELSHRTV